MQFHLLRALLCMIGLVCTQTGLTDGELNSSFGSSGYTAFADSGFSEFHVQDILFQGDKILVAGLVVHPFEPGRPVMKSTFYARFSPDGSLDETFGNNPDVAAAFPGVEIYGEGFLLVTTGSSLSLGGVTISDEGKLLTLGNGEGALGITRISNEGVFSFIDGRFNLEEISFFQSSEFSQFPDTAVAHGIQTQADGKILFFGGLIGSPGGFVARLTRDGAPDSGFAGNGYLEVLVDDDSTVSEVVLLDDGRMYIGGTFLSPLFSGRKGFVARLTSRGEFDATFGENGIVTLEVFNSEIARGMACTPDGGIYTAWDYQGGFYQFLGPVVKINPVGNLDPSFGDGGVLDMRILGNLHDKTGGLDVLEDGQFIRLDHISLNLSMSRYSSVGDIDPDFVRNSIDFNTSRASIMRIKPDGTIFVGAPETNSALDAGFRVYSLKNSVPPLTPRFGQQCTLVNNHDIDDDGVGNESDNCPMISNPQQENNDGDSMGDVCDPDDDNDGRSDSSDANPFLPEFNMCTGDNATIGPWSVNDGESLDCRAQSSINTLGDFFIRPGADVLFMSREINLLPGFNIEAGGTFSAIIATDIAN